MVIVGRRHHEGNVFPFPDIAAEVHRVLVVAVVLVAIQFISPYIRICACDFDGFERLKRVDVFGVGHHTDIKWNLVAVPSVAGVKTEGHGV